MARALRKRAPATEGLAWEMLRERRLDGLKFRRQVPVGPYLADVLRHRHRPILKADGPFDDEGDERRDAWLKARGYRLFRFTNAPIANDRDAVVEAILKAVELRL